ncbi:beta-hexosaminidase [Cordyceps javanica]|uniref:beta-N-acetylhexosaminidase n=1 Tax=Cordyceps javanica TaxID=43265 RepID=A0A545VM20_9HYPO|nr:beta-hexosaminidase [Cordyceps javanica]TQW02778.1 beta-hexosaminidase [Cordyceps javanica]
MLTFPFLVLAIGQAIMAQCQLIGIPTTPYVHSGAVFSLRNIQHVVVDAAYAQHRDTAGQTLIPPTLREFADTFAEDLKKFDINVDVVEGSSSPVGSIFLTISNNTGSTDAAGRPTSEGYNLTTTDSGITIVGASPLGAWWGTRTIIQQVILKDSSIAAGTAIDAPGWSTRGMMLDVGRHFFPKDFITDVCAYMSFYKQNTLQLHLSDNVVRSKINRDNFMKIYGRFRLWSDSEAVKGLNNHLNESYTREDFEEIQSKCAARGVTILPEIEAPGHSLPIVQWKPQLGNANDLSQLNIAHPETIPTLKAIWKEFLPWFHSRIVSIGADEYTGSVKDYNKYVIAMNEFIGDAGKRIKIWATFPPRKSQSAQPIPTDVSIQHWAYSFDNPLDDYIKHNYSVTNSDEMYYIVLKCCGYGRTINLNTVFSGNPAGHGAWYPNIFSSRQARLNPSRSESLVEGAIAPMWNDRGPSTSVYSEAYYAWRDGIPALADKQWGGNLTKAEFDTTFPKLVGQVPAQNLERTIPSQGNSIFEYNFQDQGKTVKDMSPNKYDAETDYQRTPSSVLITPNCSLTTPLDSKGRDYTLSMTIQIDELLDPTNTTLIAGRDSVLMLTPDVTLFAAGNYYRLKGTIPLKKRVGLKIIGRGAQTFAAINGGKEQEFITRINVDDRYTISAPMAIEAPLKAVTGWTGEIVGLNLTNKA